MHGGDIYSNKVKYDFSVNLNPLGLPKKVKKELKKNIAAAEKYPDRKCGTLLKKLCTILKQKYNADFYQDTIVFGNGASELIPAILRAAGCKNVMLVAPCFSGYKTALESVNACCTSYFLLPENNFELGKKQAEEIAGKIKESSCDGLILTNPNNPNGKLLEPDVVDYLVKCCREMNVLLILDECFMELTGKSKTYSYIPKLKDDRIVILRAFTKTYAMAGLRLGYCLCKNSELIRTIKNQLPEWNVSSISQIAGAKALEQINYVLKGNKLIEKQRALMESRLRRLGFEVFSSDVNFVLFKSSVLELKGKLLEEEILIRDCYDYPGLEKGFYRVAVKTKKENKKLFKAIKKILKDE